MAATVTHTAVIAAGATKSGACDLGNVGGEGLAGFILPDDFTGTAITFEVNFEDDDDTYKPLYNAGSALSITVAQARAQGLTADQRNLLRGWRFIKLVSGSTEAAERSIKLLVK
jgi:hypothetical protein